MMLQGLLDGGRGLGQVAPVPLQAGDGGLGDGLGHQGLALAAQVRARWWKSSAARGSSERAW